MVISTFSMGTCASGSSIPQYVDLTENCFWGVSSVVNVNLIVIVPTLGSVGVAGAGVVVVVEVGVGVVVEAGRVYTATTAPATLVIETGVPNTAVPEIAAVSDKEPVYTRIPSFQYNM